MCRRVEKVPGKGVVHNDLKDNSSLVGDDPEGHVIDFGRAESDVVDDCAAGSLGGAPVSPVAYLEDALRRLKNKLRGGPSGISW